MKEKISTQIKKLESYGISNIDLLALVTNTSYEIVFYGDYQGKNYQCNEMSESGIIDGNILADFYHEIAIIIRESEAYLQDNMNIVTYTKDGSIEISQDEKNCRIYRIKKAWKNSL